MDDDDIFKEIEELNKTKPTKVQFKRKPTNFQKVQRTKLSFNDDDDEDGDDDNVTIEPTSKISFLKRPNKSTTPEPTRRPIDLSKYRNKETPEEEILLDLDDDPENNPVIANIDELKGTGIDKIRQYNAPDMFPPPEPPKKYVPIETNRDPDDSKMSVRKYATALVNEYKDDKNYDDGTEKQEKEETVEEGDAGNEVQLDDEDMGTLSNRIDFDSKFDFEIQSEDDEEDEEDGNGGVVEILSVNEQILNIAGLIRQCEITQREKQNLLANLTIEKEELAEKKKELIGKLNSLVI
ncbi:hypothetical protein Cantr_00824 [Candida viswanathii]|uniref:Uncharacterized protein n=1 Tax=Candida viswanathii TaxID=5486 RepID=A0A367YIR3_9ASCO|nr:hypothetical protein Cantr_00824 [Candida viswanathii]